MLNSPQALRSLPAKRFDAVAALTPMKRLYHRMSSIGLPRTFVRDTALPDWWDDSIGDNPAGLAEGILLLARHLGLELSTLQDENAAIALRDFGPCKFKKTIGTTDDDLAIARALGTRAAQLAATATQEPPQELPRTAEEIRLAILDRGRSCVDLPGLVEFCWSMGIPVVHVGRLPRGAKKMHGMAARFQGRPVIVLCKKDKPTAWLLFILAHELGHLALGHVSEEGVLIDQDIDNNESDAEEQEANRFAVTLLTSKPDCRFVASGRWPNAEALAKDAHVIGAERHIDPGHVVLNYAHSMGPTFWGVANGALKILEPRANAPALIRRHLARRLDWSALPKESAEFLARVVEAEP